MADILGGGVCVTKERYHGIGVTEKQSWIRKRESGAEGNVGGEGIDGRAFVLAS